MRLCITQQQIILPKCSIQSDLKRECLLLTCVDTTVMVTMLPQLSLARLSPPDVVEVDEEVDPKAVKISATTRSCWGVCPMARPASEGTGPYMAFLFSSHTAQLVHSAVEGDTP